MLSGVANPQGTEVGNNTTGGKPSLVAGVAPVKWLRPPTCGSVTSKFKAWLVTLLVSCLAGLCVVGEGSSEFHSISIPQFFIRKMGMLVDTPLLELQRPYK